MPELLDDYAADRGASAAATLPARYAARAALGGRIAEALPLERPGALVTTTCCPANVLRPTPRRPRDLLVDWEYAGMGHPMFDLGNLAVNNEFDAAAEDRLLAAYFGEPPTDGRRAALELMRLMSDAREAAWGVVQGVISELDFDFADYADKHFDAPRSEPPATPTRGVARCRDRVSSPTARGS